MFKNNSIAQMSMLFAVIGISILVIIKVLATKYSSSFRKEHSALASVVRMIDKTMRVPKACATTLRDIPLNHKIKNLSFIQSANGFAEFTVKDKLTNNYVLDKLTGQYIGKNNDKNLIILRIIFKNMKNQQTRQYLKLFSTKKSKNKIVSCLQLQEIGPLSNEK